MSLKEITVQMHDLSIEELDQLINRAKAMRSLAGNGGNNAPSGVIRDNSDLAFVLKCASETAQQLGADQSAYFQLHKAANNSPVLREKISSIMIFLRQQAGVEKARQYALLCVGMRLLYKDMTEAGYPVSARTILAHIHRLPAIMNKNFPGYAYAGMLHLVIRSRKQR